MERKCPRWVGTSSGFKESLRNTITWTLANPQWLNLKKWADDPESAAYASDSESFEQTSPKVTSRTRGLVALLCSRDGPEASLKLDMANVILRTRGARCIITHLNHTSQPQRAILQVCTPHNSPTNSDSLGRYFQNVSPHRRRISTKRRVQTYSKKEAHGRKT